MRDDALGNEPLIGVLDAPVVERDGRLFVRLPVIRSEAELARFVGGRNWPPPEEPTSSPGATAVIVGHMQIRSPSDRALLIPLNALTVSFSDGLTDSRLTVFGATDEVDHAASERQYVPRERVETLATLWVESTGRRGTKNIRRDTARYLRKALAPDTLLSEVDDRVAMKVAAFIEEQQLAYNTTKNLLHQLSSMWRFLGRRYQFGYNPFRGIARGAVGRRTEPRRPFSDDEIVAFFNGWRDSAHDDLMALLLAVALYTGTRRLELHRMRTEHLEESSEATWWTIPLSKTSAGTRRIPVVHPVIRELMRIWLRAPHGTVRSVLNDFPKYRRAVKVDSPSSIHSARARFVVMLEQTGVEHLPITRYLGHRPADITFYRYSTRGSDRSLLRIARKVRYAPEVEAALEALASRLRARFGARRTSAAR